MGLDMYLNAKRFLWHNEEELAAAIAAQLPDLSVELRVKEVTVEAGYWRKANHIHQWFVKNVQEGEDDCGDYRVSRDKLQELRDLCQRVIDFRHLATELLPTREGFFFGGTNYDDYYFGDLASTVEMLDKVLLLPNEWQFEYHSSW